MKFVHNKPREPKVSPLNKGTRTKEVKVAPWSTVYHCLIYGSIDHKIYDCPHMHVTQKMFGDKTQR
jgi:hypothetical protein